MELVAIVIALALIEYIVFSALVGRARAKYKVPAPAMSGDPIFERFNRVHQNTLESLITFIPSIVLFAYYIRPDVAAGLGVVFIIGRALYLKGYVKDPKSRELGSMLSGLPIVILLLGGLVGAVLNLINQ